MAVKLDKTAPQAVTGNRLGDGLVVFLTAAGGWSTRVADAAVAPGGPEADALLARAEADADRAVVVAPYLIALEDADTRTPAVYRERIRAFGPSVPLPNGREGRSEGAA